MIVIFLLFYSEFDNWKCYTGLSIMKCIPMGIKFEQKKNVPANTGKSKYFVRIYFSNHIYCRYKFLVQKKQFHHKTGESSHW